MKSYLLLLVQFLDKSAFVQLGDKADIDEFLGLSAPDLGSPEGDDIVNGFQPAGDGIRRGNEILLEYSVGAFQILRIAGP
jgi:hypothetical protein